MRAFGNLGGLLLGAALLSGCALNQAANEETLEQARLM